MKFRCPYCQRILGEKPVAHCPQCGKTMIIPDHLLPPNTRRERMRRKEQIRREAERRRRELAIPPTGFGRQPSVLLLILLVMALVGGLLLGRAKQRFPETKRTRVELAQHELNVLRIALERLHEDCGRYPATSDGLIVLLSNPGWTGWDGPYIRLLHPDPWGSPYVYRFDGNRILLKSRGPDGVMNTADDVTPSPKTMD